MLDYSAATMSGNVRDPFDTVKAVGLTLPNVEVACKYDGSTVLKVDGVFMAGLATHPSAEPDTLVVRAEFEDRDWLLADAPETYYLTDSYRNYPVVLVRLSRIDREALHDLLATSWRLTVAKRGKTSPRSPSHHTRRTQRSHRTSRTSPT